MTLDGVNFNMGVFKSPEAAAFAYDFAASALHGQFAAINFKLADRTIQALGEFRRFLLSTEKGREDATA